MENIEQLCISLAAAKDTIKKHNSRIAGTQAEINQAMERVRTYFSDQQPGREIVRLLSLALNELIRADNALYLVSDDIATYIANLQK